MRTGGITSNQLRKIAFDSLGWDTPRPALDTRADIQSICTANILPYGVMVARGALTSQDRVRFDGGATNTAVYAVNTLKTNYIQWN